MPDTSQSDSCSLPRGVDFREPSIAERNLFALSAGLSSAAYQRLVQVLPDMPDTDSVLTYVNRLLENWAKEPRSQTLTDPELLHYSCLIFGQSRWLSEAVIRNPSLLPRAQKQKELGRAHSREEFREEFARMRTRSAGTESSLLLAKFRKAAYVRILLRDILGIAKLAEITEEISVLSDALIEEALNAVRAELIAEHGIPRSVDSADRQYPLRFAVISLGKLGGSELNYSSDVDLMFLYEGGREPSNSILTNREFFLRLAERTTDVLSRPTVEGQVFRIDLRLRPEGRGGDAAVSLPRAIQYYSGIAQDWELQAMIKARHTAGDASLTAEFLRAIEPAVYQPDVNFAAVKTALQSRERMDKRNSSLVLRSRSINPIDVKLGRGGIRDIEFLVQCLQRVYGGEETWLHSRGTLFALQKLHDKEHISGKDFHTLTKAYEFLRCVEHRLQLRNGQQVHQLPADEAELKVLAKSVAAKATWRFGQEFVSEVKMQMAAVSDIYHRVVYVNQSREGMEQNIQSQLTPGKLSSAEDSYSQVMHRLAIDAPQLINKFNSANLSQHARRNVARFLNSAATSQERLAAVLTASEAMHKAIEIFENSQFLADLLVRYPADIGALQVSGRNDLSASNCVDFAQAQKSLRKQYREAILSANSDSLSTGGEIWALLFKNAEIAEEALRFALTASGAPPGFSVMALGRLGSREFDVLSDADLLFVADESADAELCRRAAERMLELLSAYTLDGTVFSIDTRLRPRGAEGELVIHGKRLEQYFQKEGEAWEGLTYLRLRYVAGSREVAYQAIESVREGIARLSRDTSFTAELVRMRQRLEESDVRTNLKTGPGGTYDIDFLVGHLQATQSVWETGNLADRIGAVAAAGLLDASEARLLAHNAEFLRRFEHVVRLVTGTTAKWLPKAEHARAITAKLLGVSDPEDRLQSVLDSTRVVYRKYLFH